MRIYIIVVTPSALNKPRETSVPGFFKQHYKKFTYNTNKYAFN